MKMVAAQGKIGKTAVKKYLFLDALKEEEVENSMKRWNNKQVTQNKHRSSNSHCQAGEEQQYKSNILQAGQRQKQKL